MKKVFITGGAGYVGSVLARKLLEKGYYVRILDQLIFGREAVESLYPNPNFDMRVGVVEDKYMVEKCLDDIDYVIHLAGLSNDPSCELNSDLTRRSNIEATKILLSLTRDKHIERFIYASSCSVYGYSEDVVNEESSVNPLTAYAKSKVDCENLILTEAGEDLTVACLRKATIYGPSPRMRFDLVVNTMTGMALSDGRIVINGGEQWRPFVHIEDCADAYIFMLEADKNIINGQIFNVGRNDQNLRIVDLANKIKLMMPATSIKYSPSPDIRSYHVNFDKIQSVGFFPKHTIEEGILGIKKMFDDGEIRDFKDINYFNIKRMVSYLNI